MLRKVTWTVLGIAGLSLLMCGGCTAEAQSGETAPRQQAGGQAQPAGADADLPDTEAELRAEVLRLRQEVARLRAQVDAQGVGGSGSAGTSAIPEGAGTRAPVMGDVPAAGSGVRAPRGTAVVNAVYLGTVRSASAKQVVIDTDYGESLPLSVDAKTRVLRNGQGIGARQLEKGEQVRAVVDMVGQDQTLEIAVLPAGE
jgi:hypothetical protein